MLGGVIYSGSGSGGGRGSGSGGGKEGGVRLIGKGESGIVKCWKSETYFGP